VLLIKEGAESADPFGFVGASGLKQRVTALEEQFKYSRPAGYEDVATVEAFDEICEDDPGPGDTRFRTRTNNG
jgi:hypothetical protein